MLKYLALSLGLLVLCLIALPPRPMCWTRGKTPRIHADLAALNEVVTKFIALNAGNPPADLLHLTTPDEYAGYVPWLETLPKDPWDRDYLMNPDPEGCELFTLGADGVSGGDGDDADHRRSAGSDGCSCAR